MAIEGSLSSIKCSFLANTLVDLNKPNRVGVQLSGDRQLDASIRPVKLSAKVSLLRVAHTCNNRVA